MTVDDLEQQEENAYILGTERAELHRLGLQHQAWSTEAIRGWDRAGFSAGDTIVDLGAGPGFCSEELAYRVGASGRVIAVDRSAAYLEFLDHLIQLHGLPIETVCADLEALDLPAESVDGIWCRWVLAWIDGAREVVRRVVRTLRPGGTIVLHEYHHWGAYHYTPQGEALRDALAGCRRSFDEMPGNIDVGRDLPEWLAAEGLEIVSTRAMTFVATPNEFRWRWPETFLRSYLPKLAANGYLSEAQVASALEELTALAGRPESTCTAPLVVEVIARRG